MKLGEIQCARPTPPTGDGSERGGERFTGESLPWISEMNLQSSLCSQLGQTISQKDKSLRGKLESSQQRFIEHKDRWQFGVRAQRRVVLTQ
jgi:hypothetical protein